MNLQDDVQLNSAMQRIIYTNKNLPSYDWGIEKTVIPAFT